MKMCFQSWKSRGRDQQGTDDRLLSTYEIFYPHNWNNTFILNRISYPGNKMFSCEPLIEIC